MTRYVASANGCGGNIHTMISKSWQETCKSASMITRRSRPEHTTLHLFLCRMGKEYLSMGFLQRLNHEEMHVTQHHLMWSKQSMLVLPLRLLHNPYRCSDPIVTTARNGVRPAPAPATISTAQSNGSICPTKGIPGGAGGKEPTCQEAGDKRDAGSIPGWGRFPGGGSGNPLQRSCLENPLDRGALGSMVHGVSKNRT